VRPAPGSNVRLVLWVPRGAKGMSDLSGAHGPPFGGFSPPFLSVMNQDGVTPLFSDVTAECDGKWHPGVSDVQRQMARSDLSDDPADLRLCGPECHYAVSGCGHGHPGVDGGAHRTSLQVGGRSLRGHSEVTRKQRNGQGTPLDIPACGGQHTYATRFHPFGACSQAGWSPNVTAHGFASGERERIRGGSLWEA
jgi:hypothetical protein